MDDHGWKTLSLKGGSGATQQGAVQQVLAKQNHGAAAYSSCTFYTLAVPEDYPYSVCEDFIDPDTELVTAWHIYQTQPKPNHVSVYQHYLNCCEALGIPA